MRYKELYKLLEYIAYKVPNVNTVTDEFADLGDEQVKYSAIVIQDKEHTMMESEGNTYMRYNFYIGYIDRLTIDEQNEKDVQSVAIDVLNTFKNTLVYTYNIETSIESIVTFTQSFTSLCAGAYARVSILLPLSDCYDVFDV